MSDKDDGLARLLRLKDNLTKQLKLLRDDKAKFDANFSDVERADFLNYYMPLITLYALHTSFDSGPDAVPAWEFIESQRPHHPELVAEISELLKAYEAEFDYTVELG